MENEIQASLKTKHNTAEQDPVLSKIVRRLVDGFKPSKIYLFGSRAKGTARGNSDYDLLVVLPEKNEHTHTLSIRAGDLLADLHISNDILFTSLEKFERRKKVIGALAEIAYSEGKELYAA